MKPRLTAVITNFNYGRFLPTAIEALAGQSRPADELILLDDASTDGSQRVVDELARKFPSMRVIKHAVNRGMIPSGQELLALATGDFFYWGSADDMVLPGFFESAMELLDRHPDAPLCASVPIQFREETAEQFHSAGGMPDAPGWMEPETLWPIARRGGLTTCGAWAIYRTADLRALGGFHTNLRWLIDWYAVYALGLARGLCWTARPGAVMRYHTSNYSAVGPKQKEERRHALETLADLIANGPPEVRNGFRQSGMLGFLGPEMTRVLLADPRRRQLWSAAYAEALLRSTAYRCVLGTARAIVPTRLRRAVGRRTREQTSIDLTAMNDRKVF